MENEIKTGTPPMLLLPAMEHRFKVDENFFIIEIPRRGRYCDLAPDIFTEEDGEFNIFDSETGILYLPSITKVLFAVGKYPKLRDNQIFVPISLDFKTDTVFIVGQLLTTVSNLPDEIYS